MSIDCIGALIWWHGNGIVSYAGFEFEVSSMSTFCLAWSASNRNYRITIQLLLLG